VTDPRAHRQQRPFDPRGGSPGNRNWPTYVGITGLLLFILVALAGGIIWYNSRKSSDLAVAAAQRLMQEAEDKITDRIRLLYDPIYAIVGVASLVPELTTPSAGDNADARALMLRALRTYPQILSLFCGFDDGDFFMVTHIAGDKAGVLRRALQAPPDAAFANEIVNAKADGQARARWVFLARDGAVVGRRDRAPPFDPRQRPWYEAAKRTEVVEHSDLYIFASSGEPGFTLSRSFNGPTPGVMGADLAAVDLASFLSRQRVTPGSTAFVFTKAGDVVAMPDQSRVANAAVRGDGEAKAVPPNIADLHDPVIGGLVAAYQNHRMAGTRIYDVAGRTYIGRVADIPSRYGRDQLLAIAVPVDEVEQPIDDIRNDTLLYSVAFLVFALPLYVTLVVIWIDRRLEQRVPRPRFRDDE
jgi:hypothetical protein